MQTQLAQVVMLPQNKRGWKSNDLLEDTDGRLSIAKDDGLFGIALGCSDAQHLYFISDDEIKEGDWMILNNEHPQGRIRKCHWIAPASNEVSGLETDDSLYIDSKDAEGWGFCRRREVKKIVASTDPSLGLPLIPEEWIQKYVAFNGSIKEVKLVMESYIIRESSKWVCFELKERPIYGERLKLTANKEVIIVDESYNTDFGKRGENPIDIECFKGVIIDQELEDAANKYGDDQFYHRIRFEAFKAGANWQKEQILQILNLYHKRACKNYNSAERETTDKYYFEGSRNAYSTIIGILSKDPIFLQGFEDLKNEKF